MIARDGLSAVLVEPAIKLLQDKGADIRFSSELRGFGNAADRVNDLKFGDETVALGPSDVVVLAVPLGAQVFQPTVTVSEEEARILNLGAGA